MRVGIIGANGQLGSDLVRVFEGTEVLPWTHDELEIADPDSVAKALDAGKPDVVVNAAAYNNVLGCETHPDEAFRVNAIGVHYLARACKTRSIRFVHISTDYVFDGSQDRPYTEDDSPNPVNLYGISKAAGESLLRQWEKHYLVRVAGLFGIVACRGKGGKNFVETMIQRGRDQGEVAVTTNLICSPTYTYDAASAIKGILEDDLVPGTYHVANAGYCSWYDFAAEIFRQTSMDVRLKKQTEEGEINGLVRPLYTPLASSKLKPLRDWKTALSAYLAERKSI